MNLVNWRAGIGVIPAKKGSWGYHVVDVQMLLKRRGFAVPVNGRFDETTDQLVRMFQGDRGLVVDGVVGKATFASLIEGMKTVAEIQKELVGDHD